MLAHSPRFQFRPSAHVSDQLKWNEHLGMTERSSKQTKSTLLTRELNGFAIPANCVILLWNSCVLSVLSKTSDHIVAWYREFSIFSLLIFSLSVLTHKHYVSLIWQISWEFFGNEGRVQTLLPSECWLSRIYCLWCCDLSNSLRLHEGFCSRFNY